MATISRKWACIEKGLDVRALLRGEDREQRQVLVTERDPKLVEALRDVLAIHDRWDRRSALRKLSARLARHTVSVTPKVFEALQPQRIGDWHELRPRQYDPVRGIDSRKRA